MKLGVCSLEFSRLRSAVKNPFSERKWSQEVGDFFSFLSETKHDGLPCHLTTEVHIGS